MFFWSTLTAAFLFTGVVLGVWMAVDVIMKGRTAQGAVAWALALILLPWLALPLYLVFGDRKFEGYVRARRRGTTGIDRVARELIDALKPFVPPPNESVTASRAALTKLARLPVTRGNKVTLLIDGEATFNAIVKAIDQATTYILIQFYIIRDDQVGTRVQKALLAACARGVHVHLLYDEIGSYALSQTYLDQLTAAGCECSGFRTKPSRQKPFRINFRNHRKIVVVDGRIAFVGGHNIGDDYLGRDPKFSPWRDTHAEIRGPAVQCVQLAFVEDWFWAKQCVPDLDWTPRPAEGTGDEGRKGASVLVVPTGPADELDNCSLLFTEILLSARSRLWLASAYFVPDEQLLGALQLSALRGVDVRVIIPDNTDSPLPGWSAYSYYEDVIPAGVKVYRYLKGFLHQKVVLSDELACISTANLDNRSFRLNFEITVLVSDPAFSAEVEAMLEADLQRSRAVAKDDFDKRPFWFRFLSRVSRLLAPIQ